MKDTKKKRSVRERERGARRANVTLYTPMISNGNWISERFVRMTNKAYQSRKTTVVKLLTYDTEK